jgi:hypothetical protein
MRGVRIPLRFIKSGSRRYVDLAANDGLYSLGKACLVKGNGTVHHAMISQGNGGMTALLGAFRDLFYTASAVKQAVFAMQM